MTRAQICAIGQPSQYWTVLLLSPSGFFVTPLNTNNSEETVDWRGISQQPSVPHVELAFIVLALREVVDRWTELHNYVAMLLNDDADFMNPEEYVKFLFDDASYSRSKRYFWVIQCLKEFDVSLADNILQVELFQEARVSHLTFHQSDKEKVKELEELGKKVEKLRVTLCNLQVQFQNQLAEAEALRQGVSYTFHLAIGSVVFPFLPIIELTANNKLLILAFRRQFS